MTAREYLIKLRELLPLAFAGALMFLLDMSLDHFDESRQYLIGWGCLLLLAISFKLQAFKRPPWRFMFILLSGFLAVRYILWRSFESLYFTGPLDFLFMSLLYLAEVYALTIHFLGMFVNLWPMRNRPALLPEDQSEYPTIDIFIPTYNESDDIIRVTATAVTQLDYPKDKLRILICDDGGTVNKRNNPDSWQEAWERHYRLRRLADELGIEYITRETNRAAKAGNLNHALNHTTGELVMVLDCDHVPTRDFLSRTVEYFLADPKLFLVQTPHFFINPTPVEKNLVGVGNPNGENDMFYREIHRSLDFWNSSFFCGSAALLRRKCLEEVGGISGKTITEDAETSFQLHRRGYNSAYLDRPMICGLSPESYDDYILQRTRWGQGMAQLFILNNPLFASGLSLHQRLCYFNSCFYWFFGLARFVYYIAPASFLLLGMNIYHASIQQIMAFVLPYLFSTLLLMDFFYGRTREPFFSEIYESVQAMFLMPAAISVILNPHKPSFKVTPKGNKLANEFLNPMSVVFFTIILINLASGISGVFKWFSSPALRDTLVVTGGWCIYNTFLAFVSLGAFWERRQIRYHHRVTVKEPVKVHVQRLDLDLQGEIQDISLTGIGFQVASPYPLVSQERVILEVGRSDGEKFRFEAKLQRIVGKNDVYNCGSELLINQHNFSDAVAFAYGDSSRWLSKWHERSNSRGVIRMLAYFFKMGIKGFGLSASMFWSMARETWKKSRESGWVTTLRRALQGS